jgi:transcriptional repressor of dcmA and dcmR
VTGATQLLNIKQAAEFLNVSEVSLRRWTNDGRLPCLRVGRKRERRFRHEDLVAFLEARVPPATPPPEGPARPDAPLLGGVAVRPGSHFVGLYDSDLGRLKLAVPFLLGGLRLGQPCIVVAGPEARDAILAGIERAHGELPTEVLRTRLVHSAGEPSGDAMYDFLERALVAATSTGTSLIREVGDMAWHRTQGVPFDELMGFEARYDQLAHRFPVISLCQYDVRHLSGLEVLSALKSHRDTFRYPVARFLG